MKKKSSFPYELLYFNFEYDTLYRTIGNIFTK